jgi:hypothetical protein
VCCGVASDSAIPKGLRGLQLLEQGLGEGMIGKSIALSGGEGLLDAGVKVVDEGGVGIVFAEALIGNGI